MRSLILTFCMLLIILALPACKGGLSPEQTPQRTVVNFLKEVGRGNYDAAAEWVADESDGEVGTWSMKLFFPDHGSPPSAKEAADVDKFIELFYRTTVVEESETSVEISLSFFPTDALIGFPSVAEDPTIPTSARYTVMLRKTEAATNESGEETESVWEITSLVP